MAIDPTTIAATKELIAAALAVQDGRLLSSHSTNQELVKDVKALQLQVSNLAKSVALPQQQPQPQPQPQTKAKAKKTYAEASKATTKTTATTKPTAIAATKPKTTTSQPTAAKTTVKQRREEV